MIAPIHMAAGALSQRVAKRWYLWVTLAFASHQVLDWCNGRLLHEGTGWPFTMLAVIGSIVVVWYGRRQWAGMLVAVLPDIVDEGPRVLGLTTRAEWYPVSRFFWSARWLEPSSAFVWLLLAIVVLVMILRERS